MSDTDTIKEFLIALGFKLDEKEQKTFDTFISAATKSVENFAAAIGIADAAAAAFSVKTAQNLDKMYFASGRLGSSVKDIQSLQYGMSQLGSSSDDALAALESLANFQRTNPGAREFLMGWGVLPEHVNNAASSMQDLSRKFQGMTFWQAKPIAEMLGIDDKALLAMQSGQLDSFLSYYSGRLKELGIDEDDAASKSNKLMTEIRNIGTEFKLAGEVIIENFYNPILKVLEAGETLVRFFAGAFNIDKVKAGFKVLINDPQQWGKNYDEFMGRSFHKNDAALGVMAPSPTGGGSSARDKAMGYFQSQGWSREQAAGIVANLQRENGSFDPSLRGDNGSAVGIAQWHQDRQAAFFRLTGKSLSSATLDDQLAFVQYELTKGARSNAGDALRRTRTAGEAGSVVSRLYESPRDEFGEANLRSTMAQQIANQPVINQTNTFNIDGSGSPASTALSVKDRLDDSNKTMARNMGGATHAWGAAGQ